MHWSILDSRQKALLLDILGHMPVEQSYLAGGTALALLLGHRISHDFGWFTPLKFDPEQVETSLAKIGKVTVTDATAGSFHGLVNDVRITWLFYPNPLLAPLVSVAEHPNFYLASLLDIGVMKWAALSYRGAKKDFIDLYYICRQGHSLDLLFSHFGEKYPEASVNHYHMVKSLSYFDDAEREVSPKITGELSWEDVRGFFLGEQKKLMARLL